MATLPEVVALRQQLQREHQELMASERAWSSGGAWQRRDAHGAWQTHPRNVLVAVRNHPLVEWIGGILMRQNL